MRVPAQVRPFLDEALLRKIDFLLKESISPNPLIRFSGEVTDQVELKERANQVLWEVYRQVGFAKFMETLEYMKTYSGRAFQELVTVKGEVAEGILEIILTSFIDEFQLDWKFYKGLIIPHEKGGSNTTELDIVLITPIILTVFEIKSYNGTKTLSNECHLVATSGSNTREIDVWEQNRKHIVAFWNNFGHLASGDSGVLKSVLFSFSSGTLEDKREVIWRQRMPVFDEKNISGYLEALRLLEGDTQWKVGELCEVLEIASKSGNLEDHIMGIRNRHSINSDGLGSDGF